MRLLFCCAWLIASGALRADVANDVYVQYAGILGHKALAISSDAGSRAVGMAGAETSEAAAAQRAFQACESRREALRVAAACEVVRLNGETIHTGAAIKARVPAGRHPLFLWRYDGPDARVYLTGSMHVMKPTIHPLPQQIEAAFAAADRMAVEVNTLAVPQQQMQTLLREHAMLPAGQTLSAMLPPATLSRLDAQLTAQGASLAAVAQLKPALVATQLAVARLTALGYFSEFGLDQYFMARAGKRPILELERVADQIALLTSPAMAVQIDMLDITLAQMTDIEDMVSEMVVAWLRGDDQALRALFDEQSPQTEAYRAFNTRLLDERNVGMADTIQGYLASPGTYFVLVGAAHLAGPGSIVDVLRARGLTGRRIYSNDSI